MESICELIINEITNRLYLILLKIMEIKKGV
jgi:hypothetical protein